MDGAPRARARTRAPRAEATARRAGGCSAPTHHFSRRPERRHRDDAGQLDAMLLADKLDLQNKLKLNMLQARARVTWPHS